MASSDFVALLPLMVIASASLVNLLMVAFRRHHQAAVAVTLVGLAGAFGSLFIASPVTPRLVQPLLIIDRFALFYTGLLIAASFVVAVLAYGYLEGREGNKEEFYALQLLATVGAVVLAVSSHFVAFFLGLELLSVSLYALIAYVHTGRSPLEAGLKYLILAGASSAFLLFGMALIYAELGTMEFTRMAPLLAERRAAAGAFLLMGLAMMITGIGYKLAVVPFHMWTPDVYEGAPAPVTAFVATVSKGSMIAFMLRYFMQVGAYAYDSVVLVFSLIAIASMFVGNLLALLQTNVKRILAYSSIAHLGYLLVAFVAGGPRAVEAVTYYLVAYTVTTLGAFGVVTVLSTKYADAETLEEYRGLFWDHPGLALTFSGALFSLAGIPLTAGFLGKFYVLATGVESARWLLVVFLVLNSAIGLFYYLRIIVAMYTPPSEGKAARAGMPAPSLTWVGSVALATLTVLLVWLGVYPTPFMHIIRQTVASLL
jgi:NADH-quinone oxidoreductase subunit N